MGKALMIQGTSSHCGKTLIATAFCRIFKSLGYRVAPFKAQNMSLNSFVTGDGKEIAWAQAVQAMACGIEPTVDMNPILIKPKGEGMSQIILNGCPFKDVSASEYYDGFALQEGLTAVENALKRLMNEHEMVLIEGAGSPAELNLRDKDIANMRVAAIADCPVFLVADIERGGVFASVIGTLNLLSGEEIQRVQGIIVNKFRGQRSLFKEGVRILEQLTSKKVLGVIPFIDNLRIPSEDSLSIRDQGNAAAPIDVGVIALPRMSNFTDLEAFSVETDVRVRYIRRKEEFGSPDILIIPGTKNTVDDLTWLKESGLANEIVQRTKDGVPTIGICGGYQMLGASITDASGIESVEPGNHAGLNLLDVDTVFEGYFKETRRVDVRIIGESDLLDNALGSTISGYEIHMGKSVTSSGKPLFQYVKGKSGTEGQVQGNVFGTYIHGIFDSEVLRNSLLNYVRKRKGLRAEGAMTAFREASSDSIELLSRVVLENIDMEDVYSALNLPLRQTKFS